MKLPSQSSIAALADTLSLVTLPVTIAAAIFFPQTAEQYRTPLIGFLSLLMAWLFLAGYRRYAQMKQRKDKEPTLPRVLLVGGQQYEAVIEEITQHPLLHREAYIKFLNAVLSASNLVHQVQRADALILMPDFTRVNCRAPYELVMRRCETATIPMARYYPAGYAGARATDVHTIPFDTPQGIVNYAAEFLLKRAVDRGRYVESRLRLQRGVSWLLATLTICLAIWAWNNRGELEQYRKLSQLPPAHHQDLAAALADYRAAHHQAGETRLEEAGRRLASRLAQLVVQDLSRMTQSGATLRITLFAPSSDQKLLVPVATSGAPGYAISAVSSIAACVLRHRLAVRWTGAADETHRIVAFHLDGSSVGHFDEGQSALILPGGEKCWYDNRKQADPKSELLCLPVATDESRNGSPVPAVGCLSSEGPGSPIGQPWLIPYLARWFLQFGALPLAEQTPVAQRSKVDAGDSGLEP